MELDFEKLPRFKSFEVKIRKLIPEWAFAYNVPEDAIRHQIPYAHGWILSNPKKAPKKDVVRFLFAWMRSAQKWGNLKAPMPKPPPAPKMDPAGYEVTDQDRRDMHDQKVRALKVCRTPDCEFCPKPEEASV